MSELCFVLSLSGPKVAADIIDHYVLSLSSHPITTKRKASCESKSNFQSLQVTEGPYTGFGRKIKRHAQASMQRLTASINDNMGACGLA